MECRESQSQLESITAPVDLARLPMELKRHVESCPSCQGYMTDLTMISEIIRDADIAAPEAIHFTGMAADVRALAAQQSHRRRHWWKPFSSPGRIIAWRPLLSVAAVAVIVLLLLPFDRVQQQPAGEPFDWQEVAFLSENFYGILGRASDESVAAVFDRIDDLATWQNPQAGASKEDDDSYLSHDDFYTILENLDETDLRALLDRLERQKS